jgi:hypothetical protein
MKKETKKLDKNSWGFWSAFLMSNGFEKYSEIDLSDRIKFSIAERTKVSEWMVADFKQTKTLLNPFFYRLNNRDLEDIATGLMTDADEHKVGLEVLVFVLLYYRYGSKESGFEKNSLGTEIVWCYPSKKVYYQISSCPSQREEGSGCENNIVLNIEGEKNNLPKWGIFVSEKSDKFGKSAVSLEKGGRDKKKSGPIKQYEFRRLEEGEWETICKEMVPLAYVNKPMHAQTKYTLKDLTDMADIVGVRPPLRELGEEEVALDLSKRVRVAEKKAAEENLGVVRRKTSKKSGVSPEEAKEARTEEKWKKADWYSGLEEYFSEVF